MQAAKRKPAFCRDFQETGPGRQTLIDACAQEIVRFRFPLLQGFPGILLKTSQQINRILPVRIEISM